MPLFPGLVFACAFFLLVINISSSYQHSSAIFLFYLIFLPLYFYAACCSGFAIRLTIG